MQLKCCIDLWSLLYNFNNAVNSHTLTIKKKTLVYMCWCHIYAHVHTIATTNFVCWIQNANIIYNCYKNFIKERKLCLFFSRFIWILFSFISYWLPSFATWQMQTYTYIWTEKRVYCKDNCIPSCKDFYNCMSIYNCYYLWCCCCALPILNIS